MAEFLAAIGAALESVTQVNKYVITPILNQFSYLFNYNKNIQSLSDQVEELNQKRNNLKLEIDAATDNTEEIGGDVTRWLEKVTEINTKKDQVIQDKAQVQQGCCYGKCPNLKLRYSLSKEAKKVNEIARKLVEESGNFKKISYRVRPDPIPITSVGIEVDSRKFKEDEIMNALKDENIYVISICGMGGVGKTTMVKKIEKRVRENLQGKLFDEVAFVVVSRPLDLKKIQLGIAEELGLPLGEETIPARARRLHKRLTDIKSVLIILDDVWEKFNFQEIGIPSKSIHPGCKIVITSRIQSICKKFEDPVRVIRLDILSETEAWNLFKEKAGGDEI